MTGKSKCGGVILAGGRASRMQFADKALESLHGKPLLYYVAKNAALQVSELILSVNHNRERYQGFELPIVGDLDRSYAGPLLGILSAMRWFRSKPGGSAIHYLACFPADVPKFPSDIVSQLMDGLDAESAEVAYIYHQNQIQPLFSLWHLNLMERIDAAVDAGIYGPKLIFGSLKSVAVSCNEISPGSFFNINSTEDLAAAAHLIDKFQEDESAESLTGQKEFLD